MNRFFLTVLTIFVLLLGACSVSVDPDEGDIAISGTIPTVTADDADSEATMTDTLAITDTTGVSMPMTDTGTVTDTGMMTDTATMIDTEAMTESVEVDVTPTPMLEPTAVVTESVSGTEETITDTQQLTDTVTMTDTEAMTDTSDAMDDAAADTTMTALPIDTSDMTIAEVVQSLDAFSILENAVEAAGIGDAFTVAGPITVFAPVDEAFAAIPADQLEALLADPVLLAEILQYHIVIDAADSADLARLNVVQSTSGQPLAIDVGLDGEVFVNDAQIVFPDIATANGTIHVINQVLIPPTLDLQVPAADPTTIALMQQPADDTLEELSAADTSDQTIVEIANSISGLSTAATAIDAAGLTDVLEQAGPFTLFVPTNPAFAELPDEQLADLLNDSAALAAVLQYHLVLDTVTSGDLAVLPTLLTASGETLVVTVEENGRIFINGAPVYQADIEASNGIIHVVGELITPLPE